MSAPPASSSGLVVPLGPDVLRSLRSVGLFLGALLLMFAPIGAMFAAHYVSRGASAMVVVAAVAAGALLARAVWRPGGTIRLEADELRVGRRKVSLTGAFACAFASGSEPLPADFAKIVGRSSQPRASAAVEVRTGSGSVRFSPMAYERGPMARLVRILTERATAGDARAWLLAQFPADVEPAPERRGRWIHPVVGMALFFAYALGALVVALAVVATR